MATKKICITQKELVKEHKKLVKILKGSKRKSAKKEGKEQATELKRYKKGKP